MNKTNTTLLAEIWSNRIERHCFPLTNTQMFPTTSSLFTALRNCISITLPFINVDVPDCTKINYVYTKVCVIRTGLIKKSLPKIYEVVIRHSVSTHRLICVGASWWWCPRKCDQSTCKYWLYSITLQTDKLCWCA